MSGASSGDLLHEGGKFGSYDVVRLIGRGGMGAVYKLYSPEDDAYFAAKIMKTPETGDAHVWRRRFANEAAFAMKVEHPNLIRVYDVGEDPDTGLCYIIMDYIDGKSLGKLIRKNGALKVEAAIHVAIDIASALGAAHAAGVVHRDIKPDNILIDSAGEPYLADLGIAKFSSDEGDEVVTHAGAIIGTPAYMAPEQMIDSHNVDCRADIYSLGVVLYEMLVGARPYPKATSMELIAKIVNGERLPNIKKANPSLPRKVASAVMRMVEIDPAKRPQSAEEVIALLKDAIAPKTTIPLASCAAKAKEIVSRNASTLVPSSAILVMACIGIGYVAAVRGCSPGSAASPSTANVGEVVVKERLRESVEKPKDATKAVQGAKSKSAPVLVKAGAPTRGTLDGKVFWVEQGGFKWHYTLVKDGAVLWRNVDESHGDACVEPKPKGKLVVPETVDSHPVVALGALAFKDCSELNEIVLPRTLKRIGKRAFMHCHGLKEITLPPSVESIGLWAFNHCYNLQKVDLGRCRYVEKGLGAFAFSRKLAEITVSADNPAFRVEDGLLYSKNMRKLVGAPPKLEHFRIKEGVEEIGPWAFYASNARDVVIPASVKKIGTAMFYYSNRTRHVAFQGNAPEIVKEMDFTLFGRSPSNLTVYARNGTTGWNAGAKNSNAKPQFWPVGDKDARELKFVSGRPASSKRP
ncbi:MAG: protein kinase [Kiritimatiellae bacterium]|nr:protein kinase [Kiritimatiellia bacterium]